MEVIQQLRSLRDSKKKAIAVLIDPDKIKDEMHLIDTCRFMKEAEVDFVFVGGSLLMKQETTAIVKVLKSLMKVPIILFPGSPSQVCQEADALLFLSVISGRNPDHLIGQHVQAAPMIKKIGIETIGTGYMLIDGGVTTTATYMSGALPIPHHKAEIAAATAMAGEMLGLQAFYMDAGSGAQIPISQEMIQAVSQSADQPLIVGGGIRSIQGIQDAHDAGADIVVIGTALERDPNFFKSLSVLKSKV
ncbi:MAG: geranylgeranylglyceryl/heptaprenylglyceryl phosphate synthase [Bacteroidota bacterium]